MRTPDPEGRSRPFTLLALSALLLLAAACGGGGGGGGGAAAMPPPPPPYVRYAALSGADEVPANASTATGAAAFSVNPTTKVLTGTVTTSGIAGVAAHIHEGAPGVAGPIIIPLSGGAAGVWTVPANTVLTDAQYAKLQTNGYYVNVHSAAFAAGEIRGQIELQVSFAVLTGGQETPTNTSTATGFASLAVNATTGAIQGTVTTSGITGTGAHIHEAAAGTAGPILIPLTDAGGGVWTVPAGATLTSAQVASWQAGNLYVNVHSAAFPSGEIRGQLNVAAPVTQTATLSGASETPANASTATGTGAFSLNPATLELIGGVATTGITGTGAHIHEAPAGTAGPIIVPLADAGGGIWTVPAGTRLTSSQFTSWRTGNLYVNVHSTAYPSGEIRGQLGGSSGGGTGGGTGGGGY
ncbi:CHRD domain-containing protein [Geothrix sp. SG200]|uniref:CHRD domain-containing protein n=1 Tax=Geothrix sp. SG200 TaxID=2922865 RepID=UPI001FAC4014|nr:CHRD domain-containing protein [Geothrix sp. SG200]